MREVNVTGTVQQVLGQRELLPSWSGSTLALLKWFVDGTLIFAVSDSQEQGPRFKEGLAQHYRAQFADSQEFVDCIGRAFEGEHVTATVRLWAAHWDARLFPTYSNGKVGGVVGILTDATDRIAAGRSLNAVDILFTIRHHLARAESAREFLEECCSAIEPHYPAVWLGLANDDENRTLEVVCGRSPESNGFRALDLSWDVGRKNGRHIAADAIHTGRRQLLSRDSPMTSRDAGCAAFPRPYALAVPMLGGGRCLGALVVHHSDPTIFESDIAALLEKIVAEITEGMALLGVRAERARIVDERKGASLQYQRLLDTIFDVVVVHRDGKILEVNQVGVKLAGAPSAAQMQGMPVMALIDPADRHRRSEILGTGSEPGDLQEFRVLDLDGRSIDVEGLTVPISHEGLPSQLSVWRDISDRKRSANLIAQQNRRLEYAQQVAQTGSVELNLTAGLAEWSNTALALMGIGADARERPFAEAIDKALSSESAARLHRLIEDIRSRRTPQRSEIEVREDTQARRVLQIHGIPEIQDHVFVVRIFFVIQDITQFRESERHLQVVADRLSRAQSLGRVAHLEIDPGTRRAILSAGAAVMFGYEDPREIAMPLDQLYRLIDGEDAGRLRELLDRALTDAPAQAEPAAEGPAPSGGVDCRVAGAEGARWLHIAVHARAPGLIDAMVQDVTERKRVELDLQETKSRLLETWKLARIAEWSMDLESRIIVFHGSSKEFFGFETQVREISYEMFLASIRSNDRERVRKALEQTLRHGSPGEVIYEERFDRGVTLLLFTRWLVETDDAGERRRLRGLSFDISRVNEMMERSATAARVDARTGLAEKHMAFDRMHYLTARAQRTGRPFGSLAIRIDNYRELKQRIADDAMYYRTQTDIGTKVVDEIDGADTFARFDQGSFLLILNRPAEEQDARKLATIVETGWSDALRGAGDTRADAIRSTVSLLNCPEHGEAWAGLVAMHERRLKGESGQASSEPGPEK
jgi:PAS domain S-box-containing protein